ncbi:MAG: AbrB family transcriptional regulator [Pseudomonadota bacterium]
MTEDSGDIDGPKTPGPWQSLAARRITILGSGHALGALALTVLIGLIGALIAREIGAPLPWMSGALLATAAAAIGGARLGDQPLSFPQPLRFLLVPLVGVAIGGQVTGDLLQRLPYWWVTLAGLVVFLPTVHLMSFFVYRRGAGYDRVTALYAAIPGGLIESVVMGEKAGAHAPTLTLLQFSRLIMSILLVPLAVAAYEGQMVGSAAGIDLGGADVDLTSYDILVLCGAAALGYWGARRIGMPAAIITGPIVVSAAVHMAGITAAQVPAGVIALTQLVVGTALGVRFVGMGRGEALKGLGWAAVSVTLALLLALLLGLLLAPFVGESAEAIFLAFAPGGVTEMSLVALSLEISVVFVTAHHVARILIAVSLVQPAHAWLRRNRGWP